MTDYDNLFSRPDNAGTTSAETADTTEATETTTADFVFSDGRREQEVSVTRPST